MVSIRLISEIIVFGWENQNLSHDFFWKSGKPTLPLNINILLQITESLILKLFQFLKQFWKNYSFSRGESKWQQNLGFFGVPQEK